MEWSKEDIEEEAVHTVAKKMWETLEKNKNPNWETFSHWFFHYYFEVKEEIKKKNEI